MAFELNDEKTIDVLIWWVEGSDGSIDFHEEETIEKILEDMKYSPKTYYEETLMHIGGLGTDNIKDLVNESIQYGSAHFSNHRKQQTIALLYAVAKSNGDVTEGEQKKINKVKSAFGTGDPQAFEED